MNDINRNFNDGDSDDDLWMQVWIKVEDKQWSQRRLNITTWNTKYELAYKGSLDGKKKHNRATEVWRS